MHIPFIAFAAYAFYQAATLLRDAHRFAELAAQYPAALRTAATTTMEGRTHAIIALAFAYAVWATRGTRPRRPGAIAAYAATLIFAVVALGGAYFSFDPVMAGASILAAALSAALATVTARVSRPTAT